MDVEILTSTKTHAITPHALLGTFSSLRMVNRIRPVSKLRLETWRDLEMRGDQRFRDPKGHQVTICCPTAAYPVAWRGEEAQGRAGTSLSMTQVAVPAGN